MKNKVLINIYIPSIDEEYEIYIPTNETVKKVIELIVKSIYELSDESLNLNIDYRLLNPETSNLYTDTQILRDTDISNNKKLILV